ncbi:LysR family transcriptional regulator [Secundilactobacillus odoratitofui DSM 19909 = JCM 15043]|uniref:LysR family transcriptional regulator n=1 Tax=Secundilactobacillus odoratitofui DSM 19909 = JCM 15043 TaxID=1423776 RepID=A0A0R1M1P8_9LACO|nr:LysR family transcriptional regulator [Secundilactobacillus odoratitofui]KRK99667.1 LysR family transcriptional regulator [Secundilactobacillus odoratitofui DSM 19909 = JCM 15043]
MDIIKLTAFVDLAETLSYTKTAARLFSTQATISKQILALEKELDITLVDRTHRQIDLTEAVRLVLPYAKTIVAAQAEMISTLKHQRQVQSMTLTIHSIPSVSQYRAFNLIAAFAQQHPEVDLHFSEAETDTLLPSLKNGTSDIVFTRLFDDQAGSYETLIEESDRFVAVLPKTNPLAQAKQLQVTQLKDQPFLLLNEVTNLYTPVMAMLTDAGITPKELYRGQRIDLILGMVNRGMGVSVMMAKSLDLSDYQNVTTVPLMPEYASQLAFLRVKQARTPASDLFWQFVAQHDQ